MAAYFYSFKIITKIGHIKVLAIGLLCNVLRFIYISFITWPWLVLPFEFVQGLQHFPCIFYRKTNISFCRHHSCRRLGRLLLLYRPQHRRRIASVSAELFARTPSWFRPVLRRCFWRNVDQNLRHRSRLPHLRVGLCRIPAPLYSCQLLQSQ